MPFVETRYGTLSEPYNRDDYAQFVRLCVSLCKESDIYKVYSEELSEEGKVIHHGPVFDLYDVCRILTEWHLAKDGMASTTDVVDTMLSDHTSGKIQVMIVGKTDSRILRMNSSFIDWKTFIKRADIRGDLDAFVSRYINVIPDDLKAKYNERCKSLGIDKEAI